MRPATSAGISGLVFWLLFLTVAGCDRQEDPPPRPSIFFLSLDTLRRDRLGIYREGEPSITPHLDAFAADGVVFRQAFAPIAFTLPSHMAMLTGVHPETLQLYNESARLNGGVSTLSEILGGAGYATAGWYTSEWLKGDFGFERGFDRYQRLPHRPTYSDRVNAAALDAVADLRPEGPPLFLFLHYYDPHSDFVRQSGTRLPYYSPPAYREHLGIDENGEEFCAADGDCATGFLLAADRDNETVDPALIGRLTELYESGIRYLDADLGAFFTALKQQGLYDPALILLTSDHGEEFREHGQFIHSQTYDESLAVPLLVKFPGSEFRGRTIDLLVENTDLLPTLLDYLRLPIPPYVQGRSLMPAVRGKPEAVEEKAVLGQDKLRRKRYALRTADRKLIVDFESQETELYDLDSDPGETIDRAAERPQEVRQLSAALMRRLQASRELARDLAASADGSEVLSEEESERLRALGYVD